MQCGKVSWILFIVILLGQTCPAQTTKAPSAESLYSTAVLDFASKDKKNPELGSEVAMLLTAFLSETDELALVERQEIETVIGEQAMGVSGTIKADTAALIGQLTGAKILITGSIMAFGNEKTLIAKIIGTETGRVFAVPQNVGPADSMSDACMTLAMKINDKISAEGSNLVAPLESSADFISRKKEELQGKDLPTVTISILEMHVGKSVVDPAAQTEAAFILQQLGFKVIDPATSVNKPVIEITGEAFSETGIRRGELVSCKGRVEIKAVEAATGKILVVDRQIEVAVDMSEQIAGKTALQYATAKLIERIVDKLIP